MWAYDVCILIYLKEELILATDKTLWTVSNVMLLKTVTSLDKSYFKICICCYVVLSNVMEFLLFRARFQDYFVKVCLCLL